MKPEDLERRIEEFARAFSALRSSLSARLFGQDEALELAGLALLAGGHVLIEGAPGLGKTTLVKLLAGALELSFQRIQFTPDLMPADIVGTRVLEEDGRGHRGFRFQRGPLFANVVLADELNRATPRTQSALLEAMAERQVTVFGETHALEAPFFVAATQNPIEMEGTYPLPEAQLDRFLLEIVIGMPAEAALRTILERTTSSEPAPLEAVWKRERLLELRALVREVPVSSALLARVARLVLRTQPRDRAAPERIRRCVVHGASPRGGQALLLAGKARALAHGRAHLSEEDLEALIVPALRHRLILSFEAEAEGVSREELVRDAWEASAKE
ncbi:MAG: AAA family ATPase [Planctomycetes bacterium]|nr:AAA family ATPase [Planctomycetota bacterium]